MNLKEAKEKYNIEEADFAKMVEARDKALKDASEAGKNDKETISKAKKEAADGAYKNASKRIAKATGFDPSKLEDGYSIEDLVTAIVSEKEGSKDQTVEELQKKLQEANRTIVSYKDELIPKIQGEADAKIQGFKIDGFMDKELSALSAKMLKGVKPEAARTYLKSTLDASFDIKLGDNGAEAWTKEGTRASNADNTKILSYAEVVKGILDDAGFIRKNGTDDPPPARGGDLDGKGGNESLLERARKRAQGM